MKSCQKNKVSDSSCTDVQATRLTKVPCKSFMTTRALHQLLDLSASRFPDKVAVEESDGASMGYKELAQLSDRVRDRLRDMGVGVGDRVGICARKSGDVVAAIFGIMKAGAAYIPTDSTAPAQRNAYIFHNCTV